MFAHIVYRWSDWTTQQSWRLKRGLFVISTDPTDAAMGLEPQESRK
ncbi:MULTISPECIES: hypothetical protein [unclassified Streptomyces]